MINKLFTEGLALVCVLDALFVADTGEADRLNDDTDALVVKVGHDNLETLVLFANKVLDGNLDVFEGNVCCS